MKIKCTYMLWTVYIMNYFFAIHVETQVHFILKDTVEMKDRVSQLSNLEITRYSEVSYAHKQKKLTIEWDIDL